MNNNIPIARWLSMFWLCQRRFTGAWTIQRLRHF